MFKLLTELDRLLRGQATEVSQLRDGEIRFPLLGICAVLIALGAIYGFFMGWFAVFNRPLEPGETREWRQMISAMIKVPALYILTLVVTFPSLYVFNALVGSRLRGSGVLRLLIASLAVTMAVLASFGPITAFFSVTTESYSFMVLLNVALFAVAGVLGCMFLLQTLHRLTVATAPPREQSTLEGPNSPSEPPSPATSAPPQPADPERELDAVMAPARLTRARSTGALDRLDGQAPGQNVTAVFRIWIIVYGLVGAQMAWILRPFIGDPDGPFQWFRARKSNFFEAVWQHLTNLFS